MSSNIPVGGNAITPIRYSGGKTRQTRDIIPLLPDSDMYVEPFAGAASILLHKDPVPVEVLNDANEYVVDFFRALRSDTDRLIEDIRATPYSRREFVRATQHPSPEDADVVERARRFYIRCMMSVSSTPATATEGDWARVRRPDTQGGVARPVDAFQPDAEDLRAVADRLKRVQLEARDALRVIEEYDHADAVLYCDPPYIGSTLTERKYGDLELSRDEHREFLDAVTGLDARVAVSSFRNEMYDAVLVDRHDWTRIDLDSRRVTPGEHSGGGGEEVVYASYAGDRVADTGSVTQRSLASFERGGDRR